MERNDDHNRNTKRKKPKTPPVAAAANTKVKPKPKAGMKKGTQTADRQSLVVGNSAAAELTSLPPPPSHYRYNYREECVPYLPPHPHLNHPAADHPHPNHPVAPGGAYHQYNPWSPPNYFSSYPHPDHPYGYPHPQGMPGRSRVIVNMGRNARSEPEVINVDEDEKEKEGMVYIVEGGGGGGEAGGDRESYLRNYASLIENVGGVNGRREQVEVSNPPIHRKPSNYDPAPTQYGMPLRRPNFDRKEPHGDFVYGSYKDFNENYHGPFNDPIVLAQHRREYSRQPPDQPLHRAQDEKHDMKDIAGRRNRSFDEIAMKNGSATNPLDSVPRYLNQQIGTQFDQEMHQQAERGDVESGTNKVEGSLKTSLEKLKETLRSLESKISTQSMLVDDAQKILKKRKRVQSIAQSIRNEIELMKIQREYNSVKSARQERIECLEKTLEKKHLEKYSKLVKDFQIKKQEQRQNEEEYRCVSTWTMLDVNARFITAVEKKVGHEMTWLDQERQNLEQENEQVIEENKSLEETLLKNAKAKDLAESRVKKVKEAFECFMEDWRKRVTFLEAIRGKLDIVGKSFNKLCPVYSLLI